MEKLPNDIGKIVKQLYKLQKDLQEIVPEFRFTLDGNLIGDIGEAAFFICNGPHMLEKFRRGTRRYDFKILYGRKENELVQVKTIQSSANPVRKIHGLKYLLIIQISEVGTYRILYNGLGKYIQTQSVAISKLQEANDKIKPEEMLVNDDLSLIE